MLASNRMLGGILLVSGTAIGAGMLALPVLSGFGGFFPSFLLLGVCWLFMFFTGYLMLEVNLATPGEPNMISMAGRTLGLGGKAVCWVSYLLLLYALLSAYITGASGLVLGLIEAVSGVRVAQWIGPLTLMVLFGIFVYMGTRLVDWVNRLFMIGLVVTYCILVVFIPPHLDLRLLQHVDFKAAWIVFPVAVTSYGYHIIIPSLTIYLNHDRRKLRWTIFIGSAIPFLVYLVWEFLILGFVPLPALTAAWQEGQSATGPLSLLLQNEWVSTSALLFSLFAIITSFLGVSLSLSDFLTDGLKLKRRPLGRELACLLTFVPPLLFALLYQRGFLIALQFAGACVAILLGILPALMAWRVPLFRKKGWRAALVAVILFSLLIIFVDILEHLGILTHLIARYVSA